MAVVCDTGAVYALYDVDDEHHASCVSFVESERGALYLPVALMAEVDYLLSARLGPDAAIEFLESVESGAFSLIDLPAKDLTRCRELMRQYRDLPLGLADASVVAAAERLQIQRVFSVDQRHFRVIQPRQWGHFIVLPAEQEPE